MIITFFYIFLTKDDDGHFGWLQTRIPKKKKKQRIGFQHHVVVSFHVLVFFYQVCSRVPSL
jgi:hypothetical protein